uniref:Uncharacterized protein n=1 Tax=Arundo donax TaxID=35708 RepID=A0A0A9A0Y0_ARUDO
MYWQPLHPEYFLRLAVVANQQSFWSTYLNGGRAFFVRPGIEKTSPI